MELQMCYDDASWEQFDHISDNWLRQFLNIDVKRPIAEFILKHDSGEDPEFTILQKGSFNITLKMKYTYNATDIRFSQPGAVLFPEEKVRNEVAVMRCISDQTSIPLPFILRSGTKMESPLNLGPFIMMSHIEHTTTMYDALNIPGCSNQTRGILDPDIDEIKLQMLYTQLAKTLLQLFKPEFPKIGSLSQVDDFSWEVTNRPLSMNMNELPWHGSIYSICFIKGMMRSSLHVIAAGNLWQDSYYQLAKDKKLFLCDKEVENGPFRLWCDDFRPANILLHDDMQVAGVIDWEFTYAAPAVFSYAPPWWLLIEKPENWTEGIEDWARVFNYRLKTFLKTMRHCEDMAPQPDKHRISDQMQRSWESGDFWVVYATLNSFAFDAIYWQNIDPRFFGPTKTNDPSDAWKERLHLLDDTQRGEMEGLVTKKLEEMEDRVLAWDPDEYTEEFCQELKRRREEKAEENGCETED
ncbi:hypothetical protein N7466_001255 [Penicillium verhagenii]|uniref:uncharacterized protein n=1 Tax=Penicillium verhagenii TaxID=1562060 RepID=UPI002544E98B|nr:uncharacterized protein N7466_001255 [Penicillium verhagenii]KAJ5948240.1 hypothetical protein N7466_001255 [Penicillium verhagenii]